MALPIATFSNSQGGDALFKALGHPLAVERGRRFFTGLADYPSIAVYDPHGALTPLAALHDLSRLAVHEVYVQRLVELGEERLGRRVRPVTDLGRLPAPACLLVAAFDAERVVDQIRHLLPPGTPVETLDALRIDARLLSRPSRYLDPLNFATNFAFMRHAEGRSTRVTLCDYWSGYGATEPRLWLRLYDAEGGILATFEERFAAPGATLTLDAREIASRHGLGEYTGSLYIHAVGVAGHDVVKYALDVEGPHGELSCTHDANAWPADLYAGLPAPRSHETVLLWVQNSHPVPIPAGAIGLALMGSERIERLGEAVPAFGTVAIDTRRLLPEAEWPAQIEVHAGRHFVRPRYEVWDHTLRRPRIAHANVERTDLVADPELPALAMHLGRGHLLVAPLPDVAEFETHVLPTPMSTAQRELPLVLRVWSSEGHLLAERGLGVLPRSHASSLPVHEWLTDLHRGSGHVELGYDYGAGPLADGWLHAIFRYHHRATGHEAETSFGSHVFNLPVVYRSEPQSYAGPPPGLSTRLFLRLGEAPLDTLCHLVYPASGDWHATSDTTLRLHDGLGRPIAERAVRIARNGSLAFRYHATFDPEERARAGRGAFVVVRDVTCRLFGYHGLVAADGRFSLDHMYGF